MPTVSSGELQSHTNDVLRQVADGTRVTVTVKGTAVAEIVPVRATRRQFFSKADLVDLTTRHQADAGMSRDLEGLAGEATDDP